MAKNASSSVRVPIRGGSAAHSVATLRRERIETHDTHSDELKNDNEARPKGFLNVGNTCYANAALQCLLSTALASALLDSRKAAAIRRYSSNPSLLAMGSGSVVQNVSVAYKRTQSYHQRLRDPRNSSIACS